MNDNTNVGGEQGAGSEGGAQKGAGFDPEKIKAFLKGLWDKALDFLATPQQAWERAAAETTSPADLYRSYLLPMGAIPAIGLFFGMLFAGAGIRTAFVIAFFIYLFMMVGIAAFVLVLEIVAPKFQASITRANAFKLAGYSMTASFVSGILYLVPIQLLTVLAGIASLYSLYLLWLGLPRMAAVPEENVPKFFVVSLLVALAVTVVFGIVVTVLLMP